jgi:CBS domain-containing protein
MKLRDLMTSTVYTIGSEQSIVNAAAQMRELSVGSLVVMRNDAVEGIVTTWDMIAGCLGAGHDPHDCPVFRHMSSPVHTGRVDMEAVDAARVMAERGVSRLPVVDDSGSMVGIVTYANLSQVMEQLTRDLLGGWQRPVT